MNKIPESEKADIESAEHKSRLILLTVIVLYALLVGTHRGEFWPFSIYPMFSQGGQPWTRFVVRRVSLESADSLPMHSISLAELPGLPLPLDRAGISNKGLTNLIMDTEFWTAERRSALRSLFRAEVDPFQALLIYRISGHPDADQKIRISCTPFAYLYRDILVFYPIGPS